MEAALSGAGVEPTGEVEGTGLAGEDIFSCV